VRKRCWSVVVIRVVRDQRVHIQRGVPHEAGDEPRLQVGQTARIVDAGRILLDVVALDADALEQPAVLR